jgi:hypothetical protein
MYKDISFCAVQQHTQTHTCVCADVHSKRKGKGHTRIGHKDPEGEQTYSSTLSLTSTLDGGGWSSCLSDTVPIV